MSRHTVAEAAKIICECADLADPELWVSRRLRAGVFSGSKIGRHWLMSDQDIEEALQSCRREAKPDVVADVPGVAPSVVSGLSQRGQRRLAS